MDRLIGCAVVLAAGGWLFGAGCGDDADGTPDVVDGAVDAPPDVRDGAPDEPIGPGDYPAGPYGILIGDRIENLRFVDIDGNPLSLADIHNDLSVKLLWIDASAGWCTVCGIESAAMPALYGTYRPRGLEILGVIFEDGSGAPATVSYARNYATRYRWDFPAVADEPFVMGRYFDKAATPMNMLVDLTDMEIVEIEMGWDAAGFEALIQLHLAAIADRS